MEEAFEFRRIQKEVYRFAEERGLLRALRDGSVVSNFILWMYMKGAIKRGETIEVEKFLEEHMVEFLDWFLFVRETKGKTIAQMYAEEKGLKEVERQLVRTKRGVKLSILEVEELEPCGLSARDLSSGERLLIRDKTAPSQLRRGDGLIALLYPYSGEYYISGMVLKLGRENVEDLKRKIRFIKRLERTIEEFIESCEKEGLKERTLRRHSEALFLFRDFLAEEGVESLEEIRLSHVKRFLKWSKRRLLYYSVSKREEQVTALRRFFDYMHRKGYIKEAISRHIM